MYTVHCISHRKMLSFLFSSIRIVGNFHDKMITFGMARRKNVTSFAFNFQMIVILDLFSMVEHMCAVHVTRNYFCCLFDMRSVLLVTVRWCFTLTECMEWWKTLWSKTKLIIIAEFQVITWGIYLFILFSIRLVRMFQS